MWSFNDIDDDVDEDNAIQSLELHKRKFITIKLLLVDNADLLDFLSLSVHAHEWMVPDDRSIYMLQQQQQQLANNGYDTRGSSSSGCYI